MSARHALPGAHVATYYGVNLYRSTSPHWRYEVLGAPGLPFTAYAESLAMVRAMVREGRRHAGMPLRGRAGVR